LKSIIKKEGGKVGCDDKNYSQNAADGSIEVFTTLFA